MILRGFKLVTIKKNTRPNQLSYPSRLYQKNFERYSRVYCSSIELILNYRITDGVVAAGICCRE